VASSANVHNQIDTQYGPAGDLPCADFALLVPLKKSADYRTIRPRIANPKAIDSWQEEGLHFFVFALRDLAGMAEPPVAVFTMHPEEPAPLSVVVVTPSPDGEMAEVLDLRQPESAYTAPLVGDGPAGHQNGDGPRQHVPDVPADAPGVEPAGAEQAQPTEPAPIAPVPEANGEPAAQIEAAQASPAAPPPAPMHEVAAETPREQEVDWPPGGTLTPPEPMTSDDRDGEARPDGDPTLLAALKKSPEYRMIRRRRASPRVVDSWQEDGLHFFVFELPPLDSTEANPHEPPVAVFTMHPDESLPLSVVVVTSSANGEEAEIMNLRDPDGVYTMPGLGPLAHDTGAGDPRGHELTEYPPGHEMAGAMQLHGEGPDGLT
jgi:hypothetical protein